MTPIKRASFPSDLSDVQWLEIKRLLPGPVGLGRPRKVELREIVNAIRYLLNTGCRWRDLPDVFPNRSTVRHYYDTWRQTDTWKQIENAVRVAEITESFSAKTRSLDE